MREYIYIYICMHIYELNVRVYESASEDTKERETMNRRSDSLWTKIMTAYQFAERAGNLSVCLSETEYVLSYILD